MSIVPSGTCSSVATVTRRLTKDASRRQAGGLLVVSGQPGLR
jgi:hypothetical protein